MSSREQLLKKTVEAVRSTEWLELVGDDRDVAEGDIAEAALGALLPQIFSHKQMVGVPDGSILICPVQAGARALRWEGGHLHGNLRADGMPMKPDWVIERYGPLTVVWMP